MLTCISGGWIGMLTVMLAIGCGDIDKTLISDAGTDTDIDTDSDTDIDTDTDTDSDTDTDTDSDSDTDTTCDPGWAGPDCDVCVRYVDLAAPGGGDTLRALVEIRLPI